MTPPGKGLLVHEWVARAGGSERVLDAFSRLYPEADIFCLWNDDPSRFAAGRVTESSLARSPLRGRKALALAAMPAIWSRLDDRDYDWVLASSHAFSHQVASRSSLPPERHFTYVHTPARYVWTPELDGRGTSKLSRLAARPLLSIDRRRGSRLINVAANSAFISDRIRRTWGVESRVIHPPVAVEHIQSVPSWASTVTDDERATLDSLPSGYILGASRFIPYKRLGLVVRAGEASGRPVVIAGDGPDRRELESIASGASVPVTLVIAPSDAMLRALMERAAVYMFPPIEDFGIMPVESMAIGTPVVVGSIGGATESVVDGVTGVVIRDESAASLRDAIERASVLDPDACRARARDFSEVAFAQNIREWMNV